MVIYAGLVEGFYWTPDCAVEGQYGEFKPDKRIKLLQFMGKKKLNTYVYDPKLLRGDNYERAYSTEKVGDPKVWTDTFAAAKANDINFYWGIAPGRSKNWHNKPLLGTLEHLIELGAPGFMLLFDDVPGGATESEMMQQANLASELYEQFYEKIKGFCPGKYCGSKTELENGLQILDLNMPKEIPLILTGKKIWCDSISVEDLPQYINRKIIIWDNWMASDTNDPGRLEFCPPKGRKQELFENIEGYLLNPCFPTERIIPVVSGIAEIIHKKKEITETKTAQLPNGDVISWNEDTCALNDLLLIMGEDWADFLEVDSSVMQKLLMKKIIKKEIIIQEKEYSEVVRKWPSLKQFFE